MTIHILPPNTLACSFAGGVRLAEFRGYAPRDRYAEEWVASTTPRWGEDTLGHSRLGDGRLLRDAIAENSAEWLGPEGSPSSEIPVLAKLLESGQRLPVHIHPDELFAQQYLNSPFGKTEAWLVLQAEPNAQAYLGWRNTVDASWLMEQIRLQNSAELLGAMNAFTLNPGDTVLVPGGTVHTFDAGVLIAEIEEPTDFSFLFEYSDFGVSEARATLGLPWASVMRASNLDATTPDQLDKLRGRVDLAANRDELVRATPSCADSYFVGWVASVYERLRHLPALAIGIVVSGEAECRCCHEGTSVRAGDTFVVPASCGPWELRGRAVVALYEPPGLVNGTPATPDTPEAVRG